MSDLAYLLPDVANRESILNLQNSMMQLEGQYELPVKHYFSDGIYAREAFLAEDTVVVGKIHRHGHLNIISQGHVTVVTEFGKEELKAPCTFVSRPGTKRAVYAHKDTIWTTIHLNPSNTQDLEQLEDEIIAPSYEHLLEEK